MTEDNTKELSDSEKLNLILSRLANIEGRLSTLESAAEDRTRETRPKLDLIIKEISNVNERLAAIEKEIRAMNRKLEVLNTEILEMKADMRDFDARLTEAERRPN